MAIRIDGKKIARETLDALAPRIEDLRAKGVTPGLTVILVGNNPASEIYVASKERTAGELGLDGKVIRMPADTTQEALEEQVRSLNDDPAVHGILVQLPLPTQIDESKILRAIAPEKDVDGFHAVNAGRLFQGQESMVPCTPLGVIRLLDSMGIEIEGKEAVVVGRSNIVGKPMAMLLLERNATVTVAHSRSKNLAEITRRADILVVAIGRYKQITADMIKPGAAVIDVGTNRIGGKKVRGDVDFDAAEQVAGWITPVPGGVGAMTIALLMENTVLAAERFAAKNGK